MDTAGRSEGEPASRLRSLDGLRGLAALVVVFHHSMLTGRSLAEPYLDRTPPQVHGLAWWLTYTPLHLLWDGPVAVLVFFVLSGYVLTLQAAKYGRRVADWVAYYPQRLLRLYLPVAGAVALALVSYTAIRRHVVPGGSWWLSAHSVGLSGRSLAGDLLLFHTDFLNDPLWSLWWEVLFSLLLPLAMLGVFVAHRWWWVKALILLGLVTVRPEIGDGVLIVMSIFGVGVLMASEEARLRRLGGRLTTHGWITLTLATLLLLSAPWTLWAVGGQRLNPTALGPPLAVLGAALTVLIVTQWPSGGRLAEGSALQWLGRRSFSLYLVHEPLVVSAALLLGTTTNPLPVLLFAVPVSLGMAEVFYRFVELPSHSLARAVGRFTWAHWQSGVVRKPPQRSYGSSPSERV